MGSEQRLILTVNTGSSSLKAAVYHGDDREATLDITRIGTRNALVRQIVPASTSEATSSIPTHQAALDYLMRWLHDNGFSGRLRGTGHRVVHGGPTYVAPEIVTPQLLDTLRKLVPIDPTHLPQAIGAIEALSKAYADLVQVACFDTAFHRTMPAVAQTYAIPREYRDGGVIRYGFHGLSYEYILRSLRSADADAAAGKLIIAHLGNGASMAAVDAGKSVETTMGFTPTGGLVMGTRSGDLDPGLAIYLLEEQHLTPAQLSDLVNAQSGLLGVSGTTSDMEQLMAERRSHPDAALAVDLFCYVARKYLGALAAVLGGVDTIVFTGGIGEHAYQVREEICRGLEFMGLRLDLELNRVGAPIVSGPESRVVVRIMATDEEAMIAEHTRRALGRRGDTRVSI